jgi:hypothetical protein
MKQAKKIVTCEVFRFYKNKNGLSFSPEKDAQVFKTMRLFNDNKLLKINRNAYVYKLRYEEAI